MVLAASASAQSPEEKLAAKLKEPFVSNAPWILEYGEALQRAKTERKFVFAYFTCSFAQHPLCKQVEEGALSTPEFKTFAGTVVPYLHVTTRIKGRKEDGLHGEKGGRRFPYIVFLDEEGEVLAVPGDRTIAGFERTLKEDVRRFLDLRASARSGDPAARIDFALLECDLGRISLTDLQQRLEGKSLSDAQRAVLAEVEAGALIAEVAKSRDRAAAQKVAGAWARGQMPRGNERRIEFLEIVLQCGLDEGDPDLAQKALDTISPLYEEAYGKDTPKLQQWFRDITERIADLRARKKPAESRKLRVAGERRRDVHDAPNGRILGKVEPGTVLSVVEVVTEKNGRWYRVELESGDMYTLEEQPLASGWVHESKVEVIESGPR
jgi:hypothetical protein